MDRPGADAGETVEVVHGTMEVGARVARFLSRANERMSVCAGGNELGIVLEMRRLLATEGRDLKIRCVTEITSESEAFAKMLSGFVELRHLGGVAGNFAVSDSGEYISAAAVQENRLATELIYSDAKSIVSQHNHLFETLWNRAVTAESRIKELDRGVPPLETRLLEGEVDFVRQMASMMDPWEEIVACMTTTGLGTIFDSLAEPISSVMSRSHQGRLGGFRWLTSIGKHDIEMVEACLKMGIDVRHTSRLPPLSFVCSKSQILASIENSGVRTIFHDVLSSNDSAYARHFRGLFNELWKNAVDARKRIDEIVSGAERSNVEVIQNPQESIRIARELIESSREILVMFSTPRAFFRQINFGVFENLRSVLSKNGMSAKMLIPHDEQIIPLLEQVKREVPSVDFRVMNESLKTNITLLISDNSKTLVIETRDDDSEEPLEAVGTATYTESRSLAVSYAAIFENIWKQTEMYEKLKLQEKMQSDFVNIAAHELRTPVQAIINYAELAATNAQNRDEYYSRLLKNVTRLQKLTDDILDAARIDSGTLRLNKERFEINALVEAAAEEQRASCSRKGVDLVVVPWHRLLIEGDKGRLGQVVSNLLSNAVKFTEEGSITVSVEASKGEDRVVVRVADTGTGIDPSIVSRLFSRFAAKSQSGTGLGLFISKNIIDEHGGRIWVERNKPGSGTTFAFEVPTKQPGAPARTSSEPVASPLESRPGHSG